MTTRLEYKDDNSSKFWEVEINVDLNVVTVRFGKIGGVPRIKEYPYGPGTENLEPDWGVNYVRKMMLHRRFLLLDNYS